MSGATLLIVRVTQKDIREGVKCNPYQCPIARAVRRRLKRKKTVTVGFDLRVGEDIYNLPKSATRFVNRFDDGETVKPFMFTATRYTRS